MKKGGEPLMPPHRERGGPPPFFRSARRGGREWAPVIWPIVAMHADIGERWVGREGEGPERKREWWPGGSASDQEREG